MKYEKFLQTKRHKFIGDGKTIDKTLVVMYRTIDGKASCIIPAMWGNRTK